MSSLQQSLFKISHADLRAIATRLQLRQREQHTKAFWSDAVLAFWFDDRRRVARIARLSPAAADALARLVEAGTLPAQPFFGAFGAVRRAAGMRREDAKPWHEPQSPAEELFYTGLLYPADKKPIDRTMRVEVPEDLRRLLAPQLASAAAPKAEADTATLLHDAGQLLLFLHAQSDLRLRNGRWLPAKQLPLLNDRLRRSKSPAPLRSHKSSPWLAFLMFLTTTAALQRGGRLTPAGWAWLRMAPVEQLAVLWTAWQEATTETRAAFAVPSAGLSAAGLKELMRCLLEMNGAFTARQWVSKFAGLNPAFTPYLQVAFASLEDLDAVVRRLLETELSFLAVVQRAAVSRRKTRHYTMTPAGRQLLRDAGELDAGVVENTANATNLETDDTCWRLAVADGAVTDAHAILGAFSSYETYLRRTGLAGTGWHIYHLDASTVARGVASGGGLPALLVALRTLGIHCSPEQHGQLATWAAGGLDIQLHLLPVLETSSPALMARLLAQPEIASQVVRVLRPNLAVVKETSGHLRKALMAGGNSVAGDDARVPRQPPVQGMHDPGGMWLAGMVYAMVGQSMPIPVAPPYAALAALYAQLTRSEQAAVEAQLEEVKANLARLLDNFAFTPPATPSDPLHWAPLIQAAIDESRLLAMQYFTAGRNMVAQVTVEPYWLETHFGAQYLRADTRNGAEAILFRLDRIQSLTFAAPDSEESVLPYTSTIGSTR